MKIEKSGKRKGAEKISLGERGLTNLLFSKG